MRISDWSSYVCSSDLDMPILLGHSMGGMTAAVVASKAAKATRGVVLVDPTFLSPQRQRDVCDSDVAEQHRRLLGQDEGHVSAQLRLRHARRSPEIIELLARARLQTRISARSDEHPSDLQYLMRISYAVFCLKQKR